MKKIIFLLTIMACSMNAKIIEIEIDDSRIDKFYEIVDILNKEDDKTKIIIRDKRDGRHKNDDWKERQRSSKSQCKSWENQCDKWDDICDDWDDSGNKNWKNKCKEWERKCDRWEDICDD